MSVLWSMISFVTTQNPLSFAINIYVLCPLGKPNYKKWKEGVQYWTCCPRVNLFSTLWLKTQLKAADSNPLVIKQTSNQKSLCRFHCFKLDH